MTERGPECFKNGNVMPVKPGLEPFLPFFRISHNSFLVMGPSIDRESPGESLGEGQKVGKKSLIVGNGLFKNRSQYKFL